MYSLWNTTEESNTGGTSVAIYMNNSVMPVIIYSHLHVTAVIWDNTYRVDWLRVWCRQYRPIRIIMIQIPCRWIHTARALKGLQEKSMVPITFTHSVQHKPCIDYPSHEANQFYTSHTHAHTRTEKATCSKHFYTLHSGLSACAEANHFYARSPVFIWRGQWALHTWTLYKLYWNQCNAHHLLGSWLAYKKASSSYFTFFPK